MAGLASTRNLHHDRRIAPAVARPTVRIPTNERVVGRTWLGRSAPLSRTRAVLCFSPRTAGLSLSQAALQLGFVPISDTEIDEVAELALRADPRQITLLVCGRALWFCTPTAGFSAAALEYGQVLVLILDEVGAMEQGRSSWHAPSVIWAAHVRVLGQAA